MRIGIGYDVHRLATGRELTVGGVKIPFEKGLAGHSDADVLVHAMIDALLGAMGQGDIGLHFPDSDNRYKDINSIILLNKTMDMMKENNMEIVNMDCIIIAEHPKFRPYINEMTVILSRTLEISMDRLNIKATTTEKLGFEGKGEGIGAQCVVLLDNPK
jgi:2-C-methyl-D-erythritol 2,4-cyclodiphosphate synthase